MNVTVEELAKRVDLLEKQVATLSRGNGADRPTHLGDPIDLDQIELTETDRPALVAAFEKFMKDAGITCAPIPAEELQKRMAEHLLEKGIRPEDNVFSREAMAMREE